MNRRGVALVLVLWLIVVLGGIGAGVVAATRSSTGLASNLRARVVARYAAESGIESMRAAIEDSLESTVDSASRVAFLNGLERQSAAADSTTLGDSRFVVVVVDASARLDVNAAPVAHLTRLFSRLPMSPAPPPRRGPFDSVSSAATRRARVTRLSWRRRARARAWYSRFAPWRNCARFPEATVDWCSWRRRT